MRKLSILTVILLILLASILVNCASATPTQYSENGHWYDVIYVPCVGISWSDAKAEAESSSYAGMNGHLATITSQGENDFIVSTFGISDYWLGGFQPAGSSEPTGNWQWVTGEKWDYTNWDISGEPNNYYQGEYGEDSCPIGSAENTLHFHSNSLWSDLPGNLPVTGYIIEYEPRLVANFTSNVTEGYAPLTVKFTDLSENAEEWKWDFNNDGIADSTEQNPSYTYQSPGNYTVKLVITGRGETDSKTSNINVSLEPLVLRITDAKMISPNELGIAAIVEYPSSAPSGGDTKFSFKGTINGKTIDVPITVSKSIRSGGEWGRGVSCDKNEKVLTETPLRINLLDQGVQRFTDDVNFTITGTASYIANSQSDPSSYSVEILLPVVVLHGYVIETNNTTVQGYPQGDTAVSSSKSKVKMWIGDARNKMYKAAYSKLSGFLESKGYEKKFKEDNYVTLWDPEDSNIGYSSLSFATEEDLLEDMDRVTDLVKDNSYADRFNVVGHSTGGLVARFWSSKDSAKFNKIVTVGTPHEGICKFYEMVLQKNYKSHKDVEEKLLQTKPNGNVPNTLSWFVPKMPYWDAINQSIYQIDPTSPNDPYFENTFNYPYSSSVDYYLIYGDNIQTDYSVVISLNNKTGWYTYETINMGDGDGYVYWESAADINNPANVKRYPIQLTYNHGVMLNDPNVQEKILQILKDNT